MTESLEASWDIDQIRRELRGLRSQVKAVDAKVEDVRAVQAGAVALSLIDKADGPPTRGQIVMTLNRAGVPQQTIADWLDTTLNAVRMILKRERAKSRRQVEGKK